MSAEFAVRLAAWKTLEPAEPEAMRLAKAVTTGARRADLRRRLSKLSRVAGAAAACVTVGFLAGWVGRGNAVARADTTPSTATTRPATDGNTSATENKPAAPFVYQVALTDDAGNITAVQKFDNLKDASNFAADVVRSQARQREIQEGQPVPKSAGL